MSRAKPKCTYLYADGHAVQVFEQNHDRAGRVEWVEIFQHFGPDVQFTRGRIVFHWGSDTLVNLVKKAWWVNAKPRSLENGSEASKKLGVEVGLLKVGLGKHWNEYVAFDDTSILSGHYCYQPECDEKFEDVAEKLYWADHRIHKVHRISPKPSLVTVEPAEAVAA